MTAEMVLATHREVFYRALLEQDLQALEELYTDDYMLVRSNGSTLDRHEVLADLRAQNLVFETIELTDANVRIMESVAIVTGLSRTRARQGGALVESHFRLIAVYENRGKRLQLAYFQSTASVS